MKVKACVVIVTQFFATVGLIATASRMLWAFAREGGLPGSKYLARVSKSPPVNDSRANPNLPTHQYLIK